MDSNYHRQNTAGGCAWPQDGNGLLRRGAADVATVKFESTVSAGSLPVLLVPGDGEFAVDKADAGDMAWMFDAGGVAFEDGRSVEGEVDVVGMLWRADARSIALGQPVFLGLDTAVVGGTLRY